MELETIEMVNAHTALKSISGKELPSLLSFKLSRLEVKLSEAAIAYDKTRNDLIKKYGEEKDGVIQVTEINKPVFYEEIGKIGTVKESINIPEIDISEFSGVNISKEFFIAMNKLITDKVNK